MGGDRKDNLRTKFSALNVNFSSLTLIPATGDKMIPTPVFARNFVESKGMRQFVNKKQDI